MKSDLLAILPAALRENLLWQASDTGSFQKFRDMIVSQAAKVNFNRRKMAVHNVNHETKPDDDEQAGPDLESIHSIEDLLAAINSARKFPTRQRRQGLGGQGGQRQEAGRDDRPPRRCPNCAKVHSERRCPEPPCRPQRPEMLDLRQEGAQLERVP